MRRILTLITAAVLAFAQLSAQPLTDNPIPITIGGKSYYVHTVSQGETIYYLSRAYSVTENDIIDNNPQVAGGLKTGQVVKIPVVKEQENLSRRQRRRIFDTHTVSSGETLYGISRLYEIPVATLIEDNMGLDPTMLQIGQKLNIRKESKGSAAAAQITEELKDYRDAINSVTDDAQYHLVKPGETIYGLSRMYDVPEFDIISANDLRDGLRAGAIIRIPGPETAEVSAAIREEEQRYTPADGPGGMSPRDSLLWHQAERERLDRENAERARLTVKDISSNRAVNVAMLLPVSNERGADQNYVDFYQGALIGLGELKEQGISAKVTLYDTSRSTDNIRDIVESDMFRGTDIIIGPVYEQGMKPVIRYAERNRVPVVSPLATVKDERSPVLYQMAPSPETKYDKLLEMLSGDKNIIYVSTARPDTDMDENLRPKLPASAKTVTYSRQVTANALAQQLNRSAENIFIISCDDEFTVDEILAKLSSMQNNIVARGAAGLNVRIVGNSRWARFRGNMDRDLYFKLKLCYVASTHSDRSDERVKAFDTKYIKAYEALPSQYAYRGYDAAKLFVGAAKAPGMNYTNKLNTSETALLQMKYHFVSSGRGDTFVNDNWALVCYGSDYTIEVR